jgi:hypothetical protein
LPEAARQALQTEQARRLNLITLPELLLMLPEMSMLPIKVIIAFGLSRPQALFQRLPEAARLDLWMLRG